MKKLQVFVSSTYKDDEMYNPDEECKARAAALKKLCDQEGMSPHAVAIKAGISTSTMSYIMGGETDLQVYTMLQGVQIGDLFDRKDDGMLGAMGIHHLRRKGIGGLLPLSFGTEERVVENLCGYAPAV